MRMQAGVFNETGYYEESILHAGDAGFAPRASGHYFKNIGDTECFVVLIFNAGRFTNIDLTTLVANVPAEVGIARFSLMKDSVFCRADCRARMFTIDLTTLLANVSAEMGTGSCGTSPCFMTTMSVAACICHARCEASALFHEHSSSR